MVPPDGSRTGRLRAQVPAHARRFIARLAERRLRSRWRHRHTRCRCIVHRTAGARREGGRPTRVVVANGSAPPARARPQLPRHRSSLTTVRAAACYPTMHHPLALPWIGSTRPISLRAQQPMSPWLGRWLTGAARHGAAGRVAPLGCACGLSITTAAGCRRCGDTRLSPTSRATRPPLSTLRQTPKTVPPTMPWFTADHGARTSPSTT